MTKGTDMNGTVTVVLFDKQTRTRTTVTAPHVSSLTLGPEGLNVQGIGGHSVVEASLAYVVSVTVRGGDQCS